MSKKGTYNSQFFNSFSTRLHGTPIRFGILIGTFLEDGQRDVVYAAPTPPEQRPDGEAAEPIKDVTAHLKSKAGPSFAAWANQHALAIRKFLPGGLEPCGCFAVVSESAAKDLAPLLTPCLQGIEEALVLTIDPSTRKQTFWQHSGGAKAALRPATVKADSHKESLLLWATVPVDIAVPLSVVPIACDSGGDAVTEKREAVVKDVERCVGDALSRCTCGVEVDENSPMRLADPASELSLAKVVPKDCRELSVSFLHGGTGLSVDSGIKPGEKCMRLRCQVVASVVAVRRETELRKMLEVLRKEISTSIVERLQLARDEAEDATQGPLQLPWRAYWRPQESDLPLWCGDYCMPDEDSAAARERLAQLIGLPEDAFEYGPKHLSEKAYLAQDHTGTYKQAAAGRDGAGASGKHKAGLALPACAAAVLVVLAAAVVPILFRQ